MSDKTCGKCGTPLAFRYGLKCHICHPEVMERDLALLFKAPVVPPIQPVAWQYRKKEKTVWDSCGEFTYNRYKDDPEYEVRRLMVMDVVLRENSADDGMGCCGRRV